MIRTTTVTETDIELPPDHTRVVAQFFVPGCDIFGTGDSRAEAVVKRILQLNEPDVEAAMRDVDARFSDRHRDLYGKFSENASHLASHVDPDGVLSTARRLLLGASFTHEYSIEGTGLCNPSAVLHPQQGASGDAAFILSVRGIGEGHRSTIGFRTGTVTADGTVAIDHPGPFPEIGTATPATHDRGVFRARPADDGENAAFVLDSLPANVTDAELNARIENLAADGATRSQISTATAHPRSLAGSRYQVTFPVAVDLSERVLSPEAPAESHGMEDARFVRFVDEQGEVTYYATYTAFDGTNISQQLLHTTDFTTFTSSPLAGAAAAGKGLALFPRKVHGRYAALSRADRETNAIAFSDDLHYWPDSIPLQIPTRSWEIIQLGNGGSPIETEAGWLVLTHGVGPMRTYSLGAILLDIDDPRRVLARSEHPILFPDDLRRDGYVPNVIYTCGAFAHNDILVLPYGIADQSISIATLSIDQLISTMRTDP